MFRDLVVLLPGITGSVLARRHADGALEEVWNLSGAAAWSVAKSFGGSIRDLQLASDDVDDDIVPIGLVSDLTLIPGFWKIDGYSGLRDYLLQQLDLRRGNNYFEFAYDWRRSNRRSAERFETVAMDWLRAWRERSNNHEARLVLVGHSMGGLVARYFLECLGGWQHARALITFGTPYRGSLNAVDSLVHGVKKAVGPLGIDLSPLLRSFPSVYELLPTYPCIDTAPGKFASVLDATRSAVLPRLEVARVEKAVEFHNAIKEAQEKNAREVNYKYDIHPIVGIEQPTLQSAVVRHGTVDMLNELRGEDRSGDGTVPADSALPFELIGRGGLIYAADRHGSLQNEPSVRANVRGLLTLAPGVGMPMGVRPAVSLRLDIEDVAGRVPILVET
jgi:pimeloyl-ACP methyl ester carboxylesterase